MKINKNLLVGLGIGLLAYYLYTRNKKKVQQPAVQEPPEIGGSIPSIVNSINAPIGMTLEQHLSSIKPSAFAERERANCELMWGKKRNSLIQLAVYQSPERLAKEKEIFMIECIAKREKDRQRARLLQK